MQNEPENAYQQVRSGHPSKSISPNAVSLFTLKTVCKGSNPSLLYCILRRKKVKSTDSPMRA